MSDDLLRLATDVATYVGAVSAGVSANALTDGAKSLVRRVVDHLHRQGVKVPTAASPELVGQIKELLAEDHELLALASQVMQISVDRSIIVRAETVSGITQTNY